MNEMKPEDVMKAWEQLESYAKKYGCFSASYTDIHAILTLLREKDAIIKHLDEDSLSWANEAAEAQAQVNEKDADIKRMYAKIDTLQKQVRQYGMEISKKDTEIEHHRKTVAQNAQLALEITVEEIQKARAEAITEFEDRLKSTLIAGGIYPVFVKNSIEKIAKELKGEQL